MLRLYRVIATMDAAAPLPALADQAPTWDSASTLAQLGAETIGRPFDGEGMTCGQECRGGRILIVQQRTGMAGLRKERSFAGRGKRVEATSTDDPHGAKSKNYDDARFAHNRGTFERSRLTRATDPLRAAWPAQSASLKFN